MKHLYLLAGIFALLIIFSSCTPEKELSTDAGNTAPHAQDSKDEVQYFFSKTLDMDFDTAIVNVTDLLKENKFGLINDIDMEAKLKEKLGNDIDVKRYRILGVCNPGYAYQALQAEPKIGAMLPCKVIVRELENGQVEISSLNPAAMMGALGNDELSKTADEVSQVLAQVIDAL